MKRIINMFLNLIYPALISLFLFCFTKAFIVERDFREPLLVVTAILAIVLGGLFVTGFIWNIVYSIKHKNDIEKQ